MSDTKNIVIIGGGVGGYVAAIRAAQLGAHVTLIEKDSLGGTCLNRGCIPTKVLLHSADILSLTKRTQAIGIHIGHVSVDFPSVMRWKDKTVVRLVGGVNSLMRKNKIDVIKGTGTIIDPKTVQVSDIKEMVKCDNIVIATGSLPSIPSIEGIDKIDVMTSDDALVIEQIPHSLLIIGGGVIGLEFAQIFGRLGSKVTIAEIMPEILPNEDAEIVGVLEQVLKEEGIEIIKGATVANIASTQNGKINVSLTNNEGEKHLIVEKALAAVGRSPNADGLGMDKLGIDVDNGRILVNERMETNIPGIYAIGDVVSKLMLAHVAMEEGKCAIENIMGLDCRMNYKSVPRCVYTSPEIAAVGLTEEEARRKFSNIQIGKFPFAASGRALILDEPRGLVKFVVDANYKEILGVHIVGPHASELIAEAVLAIQTEATYESIASCIHAHPTLSEAMMEAALAVVGQTINI